MAEVMVITEMVELIWNARERVMGLIMDQMVALFLP